VLTKPQTGPVTVSDLASTIAGPNVMVNSSSYAGNLTSSGIFYPAPMTTPPGPVPFPANDGVVLTSGRTDLMLGHAEPGYNAQEQVDNSATGDAELDDPDHNGSNTIDSTDASVLTMNVTPAGSTLTLQYVFGSDEYPTATGPVFDDRTAILMGAGTSCARVPSTNTFVSVINVSGTTNAAFYRDNAANEFPSVGLDGMTTLLSCTKAVTPGVPLALKLAVGDGGDHAGDSALVLSPNSLQSTPPDEPDPPSNEFTVGGLKRNKVKGTATLPVTVPGPGTLALRGRHIAPRDLSAGDGTSTLLIKATGSARKRLKKKGKVVVFPKITYTPTGGTSASLERKVKLKKA
jgi:hypothetical protein